jgi:uncharacterized membrane protein YfcA
MPDDPLILIALLAAVFFAGLTQGTTGFGFALVAVPPMTILVDPQIIVPALLVQTLMTGTLILLHARKHLCINRMWLLPLSGVAGIPAGTLILVVLDPGPLRVLIGIVVVIAALAMMAGFRRPIRNERVASVPVGFVSGTLSASTGLSGPPVIFFYTNQSVDIREFRANIVAHFFIMNIATIPIYIISGLFTGENLLLSAQLLPATLVGVTSGIVINRWVREALFRRIALGLILASGTIAVVSGAL